MLIESISIGGFANIQDVTLQLSDLTAIVAPNGYGKSNIMKSIEFCSRFLSVSEPERQRMMSMTEAIPNKQSMLRQDFKFEITGLAASISFVFGFSFRWAHEENHGAIVKEWLRFKQDERKFRQAVLRENDDEFKYLSSPSGRCNVKDSVSPFQLALEKISSNESLFYSLLIKQIISLSIPRLDTLDNPDSYFSADNTHGIRQLDNQTLSEYLFHLKEQQSDIYGILHDGIMALIPHLTRFEPQEIILADGRTRLYDILIDERNSGYPTSVRQISSGSKRVLLLLTLCLAAKEKGYPLLMIEEPENSVHPRLLENLLLALHDYAGDTKILLTSHSPYLMRYMKPRQMYFGLPSEHDVALFAQIKDGKVRTLAKYASSMELTIGEYMFDFMLDLENETDKLATFFQL